MGYIPVRYDSRVVIYERKMFIRLATDAFRKQTTTYWTQWSCLCKMNTTAIKCRITSKSTCTPNFGHYRGYSYNSNSCIAGAGGIDTFQSAPYCLVNSTPVLSQRSSSNSFTSWQLVNRHLVASRPQPKSFHQICTVNCTLNDCMRFYTGVYYSNRLLK